MRKSKLNYDYFADINKDGNLMTIEERIANAFHDMDVLVFEDGVEVKTKTELVKLLQEKGIIKK